MIKIQINAFFSYSNLNFKSELFLLSIRQVSKLERVYQQALRELDKINSDISTLKEELSGLHENYEAAMIDRQRLQQETEVMERRLIAADKLISGLGSEKTR